MNAKGYTLIELMIIVAILGVLSAIALPAVKGPEQTQGQTTSETSTSSMFSTCTSMCKE